VLGSFLMDLVPGNITEVTSKTSNLLTGPIFGLFVFALFIPRVRAVGATVGTVAGIIAAALVAFSGPIFGFDPETGGDPVSFQWVASASLLVQVAVGWTVSAVWENPKPQRGTLGS